MKIKCIVAATNPSGESDLFFCIVEATQEQIDEEHHYEAAKTFADSEGYESALAYDENDSAGNAMLPLFNWETASVVDVNGKEIK